MSCVEKVEIGVFWMYLDGYIVFEELLMLSNLGILKSKIEDFGVYANKYYLLDVSFFKSLFDVCNLDLLMKKYWVNIFSLLMLLVNWKFIAS